MPTAAKPERVARILVERHFSVEKQIVKYNAFLPALSDGAWSTSVFDADGLTDSDVWALGERHVASARNKPVYGYPDISVLAVEEQRLTVDRAEPPPRHCDIVGWPSAKEERISVAQELAAQSTLKLKLRE